MIRELGNRGVSGTKPESSVRSAYKYPARERAPGTRIQKHLVVPAIGTREVGIESICKSDPKLSVDEKLDGILGSPVVLGISAHVARLFNFDPAAGCGLLCRVELFESLALKPVAHKLT